MLHRRRNPFRLFVTDKQVIHVDDFPLHSNWNMVLSTFDIWLYSFDDFCRVLISTLDAA